MGHRRRALEIAPSERLAHGLVEAEHADGPTMSDYEPKPITEDELPDLALEVLREYEAVRACASLLFVGYGKLSPIIHSVLVEALNLHVRALTDFFKNPMPSGKRLDDVVAVHFDPTWDWLRYGGPDLIWLHSAVVPGIQKRTAHITAYRTRVSVDWDAQPIVEIGSCISGVMARFLKRLTPERRAWFTRDGAEPNLGWVFEDLIGMEVDPTTLGLLLGTSRPPSLDD